MAAIKDTQLKFSVEIPMTNAHLVKTFLYVCLSVMVPIYLSLKRFRDFLRVLSFSLYFFSFYNWTSALWLTLSVCPFHDFLCFATYECCHPCFKFKAAYIDRVTIRGGKFQFIFIGCEVMIIDNYKEQNGPHKSIFRFRKFLHVERR